MLSLLLLLAVLVIAIALLPTAWSVLAGAWPWLLLLTAVAVCIVVMVGIGAGITAAGEGLDRRFGSRLRMFALLWLVVFPWGILAGALVVADLFTGGARDRMGMVLFVMSCSLAALGGPAWYTWRAGSGNRRARR